MGLSMAAAKNTSWPGLSMTRSRLMRGVTSAAVRGLSPVSAAAGTPRRANSASYWAKRARLRSRMQKSPHWQGRAAPSFF